MLTRKTSLFVAITATVALVGTANIAHAAKGLKGAKGTHAGGRIKSIDATAKCFVVERGGKNGKAVKEVTILTTDKTEFKKGEDKAAWADLKTGMRVQADGEMGSDGKFKADTISFGGRKNKAADTPAK